MENLNNKFRDDKHRFEDIKYSPNYDYIIFADYNTNSLYIRFSENNVKILQCKYFDNPHNISFFTNEIFVVANRSSNNLCIIRLPNITDQEIYIIEPLLILESRSPTACVVYKSASADYYTLLVGEIGTNSVIKYEIDLNLLSISSKKVLIKNYINIPDGIAITNDNNIIAISNHNTGQILLYKNDDNLNEFTSPQARLNGILFPHGVKFSNDSKYIYVTDAGSPFIFIFYDDTCLWNKNLDCYKILKLMDDKYFIQSGRLEEGGYKGIDLNHDTCILTSEFDYFASFKIDELLAINNCNKIVSWYKYKLALLCSKLKRIKIYDREFWY